MSISLRIPTLVLLLAMNSVAMAFDQRALWLPSSYKKLAPELRQAALKAEATDQCVKLIRASLHESTTGLDQAAFLLVCKDSNNKTFPIIADANTLDFTYLVVEPQGPSEEELLQERITRVWQECQVLFQQKTRLMRNMQRLSEDQPTHQLDEQNLLTMDIDFDAENIKGDPLRYRATCSSHDQESPATIRIRSRR